MTSGDEVSTVVNVQEILDSERAERDSLSSAGLMGEKKGVLHPQFEALCRRGNRRIAGQIAGTVTVLI